MKQKWDRFVNWMTKSGIPLPHARDPKTKKASVSYTLVVISSFFVMLGLANKFAKIVDGVDMESALYWAGMCYGLYFVRKSNLPSSGAEQPQENKDAPTCEVCGKPRD